jgi:hypothetical protein
VDIESDIPREQIGIGGRSGSGTVLRSQNNVYGFTVKNSKPVASAYFFGVR